MKYSIPHKILFRPLYYRLSGWAVFRSIKDGGCSTRSLRDFIAASVTTSLEFHFVMLPAKYI